MKIITAALLFAATQLPAQQDTVHLEEVVITGTRFDLPVEKSGKTIYKISRSEIEDNAGKTVADLLNSLPGLEMNGAYGTPGFNISYSARGGRTNNVLILIDGHPLNDPSAISAFYDLRTLALDQVESIEVLNGGLSTLYGSGASAGVINIRLKEAPNEVLGGAASINGGSYGTFSQDLWIGGKKEKLSYMISGNNYRSDGFSAAIQRDINEDYDNDGFRRKNILAKVGYRFTEAFDLDLTGAINQMRAEYDAAPFVDADNDLKNADMRIGVNPSFHYERGKVELNMIYAANKNDFRDAYPAKYKGRNFQADLTHQHQFGPALKGFFGVNFQRLAYKQEEVNNFGDNQFDIIDPYASLLYESNAGFTVHLGTRLNTHSEYGQHLIYNINPSYLISLKKGVELKLKTSLSTAFVTPSLYQLYSFLGNEDLKPEESVNYDAGFSLYLSSILNFNATYFIRDEKEVIDFVMQVDENGNFVGGRYENLQSKRQVKGIELQMDWQLSERLKLNGYLSKIDMDDSSPFYRIPEYKWGGRIDYSFSEKGSLSLNYKKTGSRTDIDFSSGTDVELDSYTVFDVYADYLIGENLKVYGGLNNVFDEQFVEVVGFNTRGRNFSAGVKYTF